MSQKKKHPLPESKKSPTSATIPPSQPFTKRLSFSDFKVQAAIIGLIAFVFYFNSFFNEFALDDDNVIIENEYVQEGFAGLPKIFTTDAYDSYYRHLNTTNLVSGGRYRPLSIATFAIEQQFFGALSHEEADSFATHTVIVGLNGSEEKKIIQDMHIRHVVNVMLYIISVIVLLYLLRTIIFKKEPFIAFLATLLFAIHPIHTEVVANVKSRDEIMSLLFMCLTLIFAYKYEEQKTNSKFPKTNPKWLLLGMLCYFLTFLSKEYAITLIFLLPLMFYLFKDYSISKSVNAFLPYLFVVAAYFAIRMYVAVQMAEHNTDGQITSLQGLLSFFSKIKPSDKDVMADPYYLATPAQKIATEITTSLNYLRLLIFPYPLSSDYSYNAIPYKDFSNLLVWLSIVVHGALIALIIMLFRMRHVLCFAIAFYLLHLLLINNFIFNLGGTMGERLIYHSSVGFALALAYLIYIGYQRLKPASAGKASIVALIAVIVILCGIQTIARNADWKSNTTLFLHDVKVVPNSVVANKYAAVCFSILASHQKDEKQKTDYLRKALDHYSKAIALDDAYILAYLNRSKVYYLLGMIDSSLADLNKVKKISLNYPGLKEMFTGLANHYVESGLNNYAKYENYSGAIAEFKKGLLVDSTNADLWFNIGVSCYLNKQYNEAVFAFKKTLQLNPVYKNAQLYLQGAIDMVKTNPSATHVK